MTKIQFVAALILLLGALAVALISETEAPVQVRVQTSVKTSAPVSQVDSVSSRVVKPAAEPLQKIEKEISELEEEQKDVEHVLAQMGFPEVLREPRLTASEQKELGSLMKKKSELRMKIFELEMQQTELKHGGS